MTATSSPPRPSDGRPRPADDSVPPSAPPRAARRWTLPAAVVVLGILWLGVVKAIEWPALRRDTFAAGVSTDAAAFAYAGELLRHGAAPYLSYWDHKPPLVHLINAAALALSGGAVWGVWWASFVALAAAVVLAAWTLRRAGLGAGPAAVGTALYVIAIPAVHSSNLTEGYAMPLQWASVLMLLGTADRVYRRRYDVAAGALLGVLAALAFFLRPNLVGAMAAVALTATIEAARRREGRRWLAWTAGSAGGAAIVALLVLGWLAAYGAVDAFVDQVFRYNMIYTGAGLRDRVKAAYAGLEVATRHAPAMLPLAGWLAALLQRVGPARAGRGERDLAVLTLALVWAPIELALASMAGRPYDHYFVPVLAPLALLTAVLLRELLAGLPRGRAAVLAGALAAAAALPALADFARGLDEPARNLRSAQVTAAAEYVRTRTAPGTPVFVWGHAADVYFFSGRPSASRFIYPLALVTPGYVDAALVDGLLAELRARPPVLLLDQRTQLLPPLGRWDPAWHYPDQEATTTRPATWSATPALERFYDHVARHYRLVDSVGPERWPVYRLRSERPRSAEAPS